LLGLGRRPTKVAKIVGVTKSTISVWRRDPKFKALEAKYAAETEETIRRQIAASFGLADKTLRSLHEDENSFVRLGASKTIFEGNLKILLATMRQRADEGGAIEAAELRAMLKEMNESVG
jgi:transposase